MEDNSRLIVYIIIGILILVLSYLLIKIMFPTKSKLKNSSKVIQLHELDENTVKTNKKSFSFFNKTSHSSPRILTYQQAENYFESYYQEYDEQQQILKEAEQKRREFINKMSNRGGQAFKEALNCIGKQDYDKAIELFLQAIREEPNNMTLRLLAFKKLALLYKQKNDEKKYYVSTYKYLEILEKLESNQAEAENIRQLKNEIRGKLATLGE